MITVIRQALSELGVAVFDSDATDTTTDHYLLLLFPSLTRSSEDPVGPCGGQVDLIVRAVGVTPAHSRAILEAARAKLRGLHTNGWAFHWDGCPRPVQIERNVRIAGTNTNLAFLDDEYTVFANEVKEIHDDADPGV